MLFSLRLWLSDLQSLKALEVRHLDKYTVETEGKRFTPNIVYLDLDLSPLFDTNNKMDFFNSLTKKQDSLKMDERKLKSSVLG